MRRTFALPTLSAITFVMALPLVAGAVPLTFDVTPYTGSSALSRVTLTDLGNGTVDVNVAVVTDTDNPFIADILGIFFDIADDSLLGGFSFLGNDITQIDQSGNVTGVGGGNNMNGGGPSNPGPFDIGLRIGTSGIGGGDDFQSTSFLLSHATALLDLDLFAGQDFGVRLQSVGLPGGARGGSSKLSGVVPAPSDDPPTPDVEPVPEPASLALWGIGGMCFILIAGFRRRRIARSNGQSSGN